MSAIPVSDVNDDTGASNTPETVQEVKGDLPVGDVAPTGDESGEVCGEGEDANLTQQIPVSELEQMRLNPSGEPLGRDAYIPQTVRDVDQGIPVENFTAATGIKITERTRIPTIAEGDVLPAPIIEPFSGAIYLANKTDIPSTRIRLFHWFKKNTDSAAALLKRRRKLQVQASQAVAHTQKQIEREQERQNRLGGGSVSSEQQNVEPNLTRDEVQRYTLRLVGGACAVGFVFSLLLLLV